MEQWAEVELAICFGPDLFRDIQNNQSRGTIGNMDDVIEWVR
jgi:hypothetical protein